MRSCMTEHTLATICYLVDFPTTRVQSVCDTDILERFRSVVFQPYSSISAVAMQIRLQVAATSVPPPRNATDVYHHVLAT